DGRPDPAEIGDSDFFFSDQFSKLVGTKIKETEFLDSEYMEKASESFSRLIMEKRDSLNRTRLIHLKQDERASTGVVEYERSYSPAGLLDHVRVYGELVSNRDYVVRHDVNRGLAELRERAQAIFVSYGPDRKVKKSVSIGGLGMPEDGSDLSAGLQRTE